MLIRKFCSLSSSTEGGRWKDSLGEQVQVCTLELEHTFLFAEWLPSTENKNHTSDKEGHQQGGSAALAAKSLDLTSTARPHMVGRGCPLTPSHT